jgi:hypothetical protein
VTRRYDTAYAVISKVVGDHHQVCARATCAADGCRESLDITKRDHVPPEMVAKKFRQHGWAFDNDKPGRVRCPKCLAKIKPEKDEPVSAIKPPTATVTPITAASPRTLTADEKAKVRLLLDGQFDDQKGMYLEGYSDQRIGSETGVPWACVRDLREVAYGPIKANPEIEALRADLAVAAENSRKAASEAGKAMSECTSLLLRLEALSKKLGLG